MELSQKKKRWNRAPNYLLLQMLIDYVSDQGLLYTKRSQFMLSQFIFFILLIYMFVSTLLTCTNIDICIIVKFDTSKCFQVHHDPNSCPIKLIPPYHLISSSSIPHAHACTTKQCIQEKQQHYQGHIRLDWSFSRGMHLALNCQDLLIVIIYLIVFAIKWELPVLLF